MSTPVDLELELLDDSVKYNLDDCCQQTQAHHTFIIELIEEHIITPVTSRPEYLFYNSHIKTIRTAHSFYYDLGINMPGIAIALELLNRIK